MSENSYRSRYYLDYQRDQWHLRHFDGHSMGVLDDLTADMAKRLLPTGPNLTVPWDGQHQEAIASLLFTIVRLTADRDGEREARRAVERTLSTVAANWAALEGGPGSHTR